MVGRPGGEWRTRATDEFREGRGDGLRSAIGQAEMVDEGIDQRFIYPACQRLTVLVGRDLREQDVDADGAGNVAHLFFLAQRFRAGQPVCLAVVDGVEVGQSPRCDLGDVLFVYEGGVSIWVGRADNSLRPDGFRPAERI